MAAQPTPAHPATMQPTPDHSPATPDSPLPAPILTTARIMIRPLHPQDAASMTRSAAPPSIAKYMSLAFPSPYTLDAAHAFINTNLTQALSDYGVFAVDAPRELMGGIGLKVGSDVHAHAAEVGYWIAEDYAGKGLMTEILAAFTEWTFAAYSTKEGNRLTRLYAKVFDPNVASMRVLDKCGYRREGVAKGAVEKRGVVMDMVDYGLVRDDWEEWKTTRDQKR